MPHKYRIAQLTIRYTKDNKCYSEEHEVLADFTEATLFMPFLFGEQRADFKQVSTRISDLLAQPRAPVEKAMKCTDLRLNLQIDSNGVSKENTRDPKEIRRLMFMAYDRIERVTAVKRSEDQQ